MHGSIAPLASAYVITLEAQACRTGDTLVREQTQAASKTDVLASVSAAAARIREGLGESIGSIQRFNVPAHNATTPSLEALKAYSMGVDTRLKTGDVQAIPLFEHALELDPNFALAAARLGAIYTNLRDLPQAQEYMKRAFARSDSLSEPERLFIKSHYHYIVTGRLDDAVATYRLWIGTYPDDWVPHSNLSTTYVRLNRLEEAVDEARIAVSLAPALGRRLPAADARAARTRRPAGSEGGDPRARSEGARLVGHPHAGVSAGVHRQGRRRDAGAPPRRRVSRRQLRRPDRSGARGVCLRRHRHEPDAFAQAMTAAQTARVNDIAASLIAEQALDNALVGDTARRAGSCRKRWTARRRRRRDDVDGVAGGGISRPDAAGRKLAQAYRAQEPPASGHRRRAAADAAGATALSGKDGRARARHPEQRRAVRAVGGPVAAVPARPRAHGASRERDGGRASSAG